MYPFKWHLELPWVVCIASRRWEESNASHMELKIAGLLSSESRNRCVRDGRLMKVEGDAALWKHQLRRSLASFRQQMQSRRRHYFRKPSHLTFDWTFGVVSVFVEWSHTNSVRDFNRIRVVNAFDLKRQLRTQTIQVISFCSEITFFLELPRHKYKCLVKHRSDSYCHRRRLAFKCAGAECPSLPPNPAPLLPSLAAKQPPSLQLGDLGSAVSSSVGSAASSAFCALSVRGSAPAVRIVRGLKPPLPPQSRRIWLLLNWRRFLRELEFLSEIWAGQHKGILGWSPRLDFSMELLVGYCGKVLIWVRCESSMHV
jgi:hypothetical protein